IHRCRKQRKRNRRFPFVNQPLELPGPTKTTDEIDSLVCTNILYAENRIEQAVLKNTDVERRNGGGRQSGIGRKLQSIPFAAEIHTPMAAFWRFGARVVRNGELFANGVEKFFRRESVEILYGAVVCQYLHLGIWKNNSQKIVVIFVTGVGEALFFQLGARATRARRTMMSIGNVKQRHRFETADERFSFGQTPDPVTNAVRSSQIVQRLRTDSRRHLAVDLRSGAIRQENRPGLRPQHQHVTRAIVFLVTTGALVFANRAVVVFVDGATSYDADLLVLAHDQTIKIKTRLGFLFQRTRGNQFLKVLDCLSIDGVAVQIRALRQVDLGPRYMQKAQRISVSQSTRFFSVDDVVRHTCHFLGAVSLRTQSTKGTNNRHRSSCRLHADGVN